ncbi:MAG: redoxin domain-containing protein [Alphaproteobacteria bacterium]|nr:redoxin domain-containing protein [Alphaproteobacteria bacterium]
MLKDRRTMLALGAGATLALGAGGSRIFGFAAAARAPQFRGAMGPFQTLDRPVPAPAIAFKDAEDEAHTLADFKGRLVVLNFWATWCAPCVEEMPSLDRLQATVVDEGMAVVAISLDRAGMRQVAPFFAMHDLRKLPVYLDPTGASMRAFKIRGLPTTIVIDAEGRETGRLEGAATWDSKEALALLRALRGELPAAPTRT